MSGGVLVPAEVQSATVSERDVGEEECVVNVEWSEAFVSCGGSLSQYVLSVTPPTPDCQSSPDCVIVTSSSQYTIPGSETQYSLTVGTLDYDITVRADVCDGSMTAESSVYNVNLTGEIDIVHRAVCSHRETAAVRICLYRECNILYHPHDVQSIRCITEVNFDHMDTNASKCVFCKAHTFDTFTGGPISSSGVHSVDR